MARLQMLNSENLAVYLILRWCLSLRFQCGGIIVMILDEEKSENLLDLELR
jgi:hypothetical protein